MHVFWGNSFISNVFGTNSKTCTCKVRAAWGRVSQGLTVIHFFEITIMKHFSLKSVSVFWLLMILFKIGQCESVSSYRPSTVSLFTNKIRATLFLSRKSSWKFDAAQAISASSIHSGGFFLDFLWFCFWDQIKSNLKLKCCQTQFKCETSFID